MSLGVINSKIIQVMEIRLKTRKMLWGRSASRCSLPECRISLVEDATTTDDPSIIGDEAHIVGKSKDGPRGDHNLEIDKRDNFDNLILLCKNHHKMIDDQPEKYTVEKLKAIKKEHINWVSENLKLDDNKLKDEELYAYYIDEWVKLAAVNSWEDWSSFVLGSGQPSIRVSRFEELKDLNKWLLSRVWPKRYTELEKAFHNFRVVLNDFLNVFSKYYEKRGSQEDDNAFYWTEKIYQKNGFLSQENYKKQAKKFDYHVDLVMDLMLELTRAANYICDKVRKFISPSFRIKEGILLVQHGMYSDFSIRTSRSGI